jgi:hypothetical protein
MLIVSTWIWGSKFEQSDVSKLAASVRRNLKQPHEFVCFSEINKFIPHVDHCYPITRLDLTYIKGCYVRLQMFDPVFQEQFSWDGKDDRLVCIDLDTVITGPLDKVLDRPEPFVIMQGGNAANPCPYNGALMMLRPGHLAHVWKDFSVEAAATVPFFEFPDDQGWLAAVAPNAAGWRCGVASGVYVFRKPGWPLGDALPAGASLVTFNGTRTPRKLGYLPWVQEHWRT